MATGIYTRVFDTVISGNSLLSNLTGDDVKALEFSAAVKNTLPLALTGTASDNIINVDQLVQASLPTGQEITSLDDASYSIDLGSDTSLKAASYVSLFNLRSTNDVRVLRFVNGGKTGFGTALAKTVKLANGSGGVSKVQVQLASAPGAAASAAVFTTAVASGGTGFVRDVFLSASSLTSGAEVVLFTVGSYGNTV